MFAAHLTSAHTHTQPEELLNVRSTIL